MKLTGARAAKFVQAPQADIIGVLLYGPDRGLVKERSGLLTKYYLPNPDDAFAATILTADDLTGDPAKLADEMSALSMFGDARLVRLRLDHERNGAAISKIIKSFDTEPEKAEAKLIIEAGDLTPRSAVRKAFEAAGRFAAIGCYTANAADLANLVRTSLNERSIGIDKDALDFWTPLLEGDYAMARSEIEKMALYKGYGSEPNAKITMADVRILAAGGQSVSIDDIIMSAMSGNVAECDASFRRAVAGKMNSAVILRSLQRHIGRLLEASVNIDNGDSAEGALRSLRPPVFRMQERAFLGQLRIWPGGMLRRALSQSLEAEKQLKTASAPGDAITGRLLLALSGYARKRK
ncbi:MAG: DNA polymerase III subunit delta [Hellea sp.]